MKRFLLSLLAFISFFIVLPKSALAKDEFKTIYDVHYDVQQDAETIVTQEIEITNLKEDVIATNYSVTIKQMQIYEVEAFDEQGDMDIEVLNDEGSVTVRAEFNENVVGVGRSNKFTIRYKTKDIGTKIGEIYTVKVPKVAGLDSIREYNVKVTAPENFGPNIFITPEPKSYLEEEGRLEYNFTKSTLENSGISASFGKYQVLNYKLTYQLKNTAFFSTIQEIALPPDIKERQQVSHRQITPEPTKVYLDKDGNLMAQYVLKPKQEIEIVVTGSARILGRFINPENGGAFNDIPQSMIKNYTRAQKFWEVDSVEIQNLKNKLYDKDFNVTQNARNIYRYITENLSYDHSVIEKDYVDRNGALKALNREAPAACMEFTDLFVATARAMGIPARELNGYAVNVYQKSTLPLSIRLKSGDLLHAWPEYFDPNFGWIPVDPTWGSTSQLDFFSKLDNSHFVFSVKGISSEQPLPAGLYRQDDSTQLVSVEISERDVEEDFRPQISLFKKPNFNPINLFSGQKSYRAINDGGTFIYNFNGEDFLPYEVKSIVLPENTDMLRYEDLNGEFQTQELMFVDKNPQKYLVNPFYIVFSFLLGLGLCGFAYYLLVVKGFQKKLPFRRSSHPQDQDQQQNQR